MRYFLGLSLVGNIPSSLSSGLSSALFGIALTNGCYYFWYEYVKALLLGIRRRAIRSSQVMSPAESLLAGAFAGEFHSKYLSSIMYFLISTVSLVGLKERV